LNGSEKGNAEFDHIIARLTIGETYFFRDENQFSAIRDVILPDILERNQASKELRIWSAGCSTGAEPYSLAILLARDLADRLDGWQICIYASDLNRSYLAQAEEAKFRAWALRSTSDEIKHECFSKEGLHWTIHTRYKQWISFHHMNLVGSEFVYPFSERTHFDLILCRNVMIYFAPEVNLHLVGQFHRSLTEGGWLVVGAPEYNLVHYSAFRTVNVPGAKLYQKVTQAALPAAEYLDQPPVQFVAQPLAAPPVPAGPDIEGLRQLADRGEWKSAAEYGQKLLTRDRLNPAIYFYQALIFENLGSTNEAERSLRQAIYLHRKFVMAHYHLGLALIRGRKMLAASRSFGNVIKVLAGLPEDVTVTAGSGISAGALKELAKMRLEDCGQGAQA
jgi:chemotaxis protein methyltransferase CheR